MSASLERRWSAESVAAIRTLANEGHTGREISVRFGVSRNTIIGVCYRNKIPLGGAGTLTQKRVTCQSVPNIALKRKEARLRRSVRLKAPQALPPIEGIPLEALGPHQCRWPVTDCLPHKFCGAHAEGTYCEHHHARAYRGPV